MYQIKGMEKIIGEYGGKKSLVIHLISQSGKAIVDETFQQKHLKHRYEKRKLLFANWDVSLLAEFLKREFGGCYLNIVIDETDYRFTRYSIVISVPQSIKEDMKEVTYGWLSAQLVYTGFHAIDFGYEIFNPKETNRMSQISGATEVKLKSLGIFDLWKGLLEDGDKLYDELLNQMECINFYEQTFDDCEKSSMEIIKEHQKTIGDVLEETEDGHKFDHKLFKQLMRTGFEKQTIVDFQKSYGDKLYDEVLNQRECINFYEQTFDDCEKSYFAKQMILSKKIAYLEEAIKDLEKQLKYPTTVHEYMKALVEYCEKRILLEMKISDLKEAIKEHYRLYPGNVDKLEWMKIDELMFGDRGISPFQSGASVRNRHKFYHELLNHLEWMNFDEQIFGDRGKSPFQSEVSVKDHNRRYPGNVNKLEWMEIKELIFGDRGISPFQSGASVKDRHKFYHKLSNHLQWMIINQRIFGDLGKSLFLSVNGLDPWNVNNLEWIGIEGRQSGASVKAMGIEMKSICDKKLQMKIDVRQIEASVKVDVTLDEVKQGKRSKRKTKPYQRKENILSNVSLNEIKQGKQWKRKTKSYKRKENILRKSTTEESNKDVEYGDSPRTKSFTRRSRAVAGRRVY